MSYVGTPEFEKRRAAFTAAVRARHAAFEARLALIEAETEAPRDVMTPDELASRLIMDEIPRA